MRTAVPDRPDTSILIQTAGSRSLPSGRLTLLAWSAGASPSGAPTASDAAGSPAARFLENHYAASSPLGVPSSASGSGAGAFDAPAPSGSAPRPAAVAAAAVAARVAAPKAAASGAADTAAAVAVEGMPWAQRSCLPRRAAER